MWGGSTTGAAGGRPGAAAAGVVVMSAWLSSQERHVRAYVELYAARGWACLVCHSDFPTGCAGVAGAGTEGEEGGAAGVGGVGAAGVEAGAEPARTGSPAGWGPTSWSAPARPSEPLAAPARGFGAASRRRRRWWLGEGRGKGREGCCYSAAPGYGVEERFPV
jgi:hypothetical protein